MKLQKEFYLNGDVVDVAKKLLGKVICSEVDGEFVSGLIVETEAYAGVRDKASHAYLGRRTLRTEVMYSEGGVTYIYLCYGMHHLVNVVTNKVNVPDAVLLRGIKVIKGQEFVASRFSSKYPVDGLLIGPGRVGKALGLTLKHNELSLLSDTLWIEDAKKVITEDEIIMKKRIGIDYAEEDADLLYRFIVKGNCLK
jgi:DNA-3-methyladenine glycosylase